MKKFSLLTLGLLALCTISTMAQSYQSKMERYGGLATEGRFLEACQLFTDTDSVSPFIKLHKQILAAIAQNQNRLAISLIDENLRYNWMAYGADVLYLSRELLNLCKAEGMHDKAASHVEWLKREYYLSQKAYYNDAEYNKSVEKLISSGEQRLRERNLLPPVHAIRKGKSQTIKFTAVPLLKTQIKVNDKSLEGLWMTATPYPMIITHQVAKQLGLVVGADSVAGFPVVYLDSIRIGSILFKNVPALVSKVATPTKGIDKHKLSKKEAKRIKEIYAEANKPKIGLPIIRQLETIAIDWKRQEISFPVDSLPNADIEEKMYFAYVDYPYLFMPITISKKTAIGKISTGDVVYIKMCDKFYKKHQFPSENWNKSMYVTTDGNAVFIPNLILKSPSLTINGRPIDTKEKIDIVPETATSYDVLLGLTFFQSIGQTIVFDFKQMKIKGWKEGISAK